MLQLAFVRVIIQQESNFRPIGHRTYMFLSMSVTLNSGIKLLFSELCAVNLIAIIKVSQVIGFNGLKSFIQNVL